MKVTIRTKPLKNKRKSIYLEIYHNGKTRYEFLTYRYTNDKEQNKEIKRIVEAIRNKRELELMNEENNFISGFNKKANFIEYFQKWIDNKKNELSFNTIRSYEFVLVSLKKFTGDKIAFKEIDEHWIEKLKQYFLKEDISQNTAKNYLAVIRRVLKQAVKDKIILSDPFNYVSAIKSKSIKRGWLEVEELKKLFTTEYKWKYPDVKRAFLFCCYTGLRLSDVNNLTWNDIKGDYISIKQQKTDEYNNYPLHQTAKQILSSSKIINIADNKIFNIPDRFIISYYVKKWFKDAGIQKNGHFHLSRHTFAVMNITHGADLYTTSKLLGHKSLKTTEIYANVIDEKKKEAIDRLTGNRGELK